MNQSKFLKELEKAYNDGKKDGITETEEKYKKEIKEIEAYYEAQLRSAELYPRGQDGY